jgi:hypothetical protein
MFMVAWNCELVCDKPLYRVAVSGPIKSEFSEIKMYGAIHNTLVKLAKDTTLADKQIVICSGGTDAGFMSLLYPTASNHKLKTAGYLSCRIFNDDFTDKLVECDEVQLLLPTFNNKPSWHDASNRIIEQADMHILFGSIDLEFAGYRHRMAVEKSEKDPNFQYYRIDVV